MKCKNMQKTFVTVDKRVEHEYNITITWRNAGRKGARRIMYCAMRMFNMYASLNSCCLCCAA